MIISEVNNILRLWYWRIRQLLQWQCSHKITFIAIINTQIVVAIFKSNVYILDYKYNTKNSNLQIQQKINIFLSTNKKSSVYQLQLLNDQDEYKICLIFRKTEVYLYEWNIIIVKLDSEINKDSEMNVSINVVLDAFLQSTENKTLLRIIKHSNFHFDAIKIIKDVSTYWLLIDINKKWDSILIKLLSWASNEEISQWSYKNKDAEFHLFNISWNE